VILQNEVTGIEIALGTNPDVVADDKSPIESALQVSLRTDEYAAADFKSLQMLESNAGSDGKAVPYLACNASPENPAHERVEVAVPLVIPTVQLDQPIAAVSG
jgi:hypothetical protein